MNSTKKGSSIWDIPDDIENRSPGPYHAGATVNIKPSPLRLTRSVQTLNPKQKEILNGLLEANDDVIIYAPEETEISLIALMAVTDKVKKINLKDLLAIIICPTCESAKNNIKLIQSLSYSSVTYRLAIRGLKLKRSEKIIEQILIATPEKILECLKNDSLCLGTVQFLVLDNMEALIGGHEKNVSRIIHDSKLPCNRLIVMLGSSPKNTTVKNFLDNFPSAEPCIIDRSIERATRQIANNYNIVYRSFAEKLEILKYVSKLYDVYQILAICNTKDDCIAISKKLGYGVLHGKQNPSLRNDIRMNFEKGATRVLVTTSNFDTLNGPKLFVVINCDVILTSESKLDYDKYCRRQNVLINCVGVMINLFDEKWAACAENENGVKLNFILKEKLCQKKM